MITNGMQFVRSPLLRKLFIQLRSTAFPKVQINERFSDGQASIARLRHRLHRSIYSLRVVSMRRLGIADNSCGSAWPWTRLALSQLTLLSSPIPLLYPYPLSHQRRTNPGLHLLVLQQEAFVPWHLIQINASILFLAYPCILSDIVSTNPVDETVWNW